MCGGSREKAAIAITEVLAWVMVSSMPTKPSFSRWTTLGPCAAWFAMSMCIHDVFRRAWRLAFGKDVERPSVQTVAFRKLVDCFHSSPAIICVCHFAGIVMASFHTSLCPWHFHMSFCPCPWHLHRSIPRSSAWLGVGHFPRIYT